MTTELCAHCGIRKRWANGSYCECCILGWTKVTHWAKKDQREFHERREIVCARPRKV